MKSYKTLSLSALHAVWMLIFTAVINSSSVSHWDDQEIASFFHFLKHNVIGVEKSFDENDFLFIDVSRSNELVPALNEAGMSIGNQDITNRASLAETFGIINKYNVHRQVFCDILFEIDSPNDSLLKTTIEKTERLLVSSHHLGDSLVEPKFDVNYSASDYEDQGSFFKYAMYHKKHKSTALTLLEGKGETKLPGLFDIVNKDDKLYFNRFVVDFRIRPFHYQANKAISGAEETGIQRINIVDLEPFLEISRTMDMIGNKEFFQEMLGNKLVVLGDFSDRDIHSTITGDLAGPLILINSYLALQAEENKVHGIMILFLFLSFTLVSYMVFKEGDVFELILKKAFPNSRIISKFFELISFFFIIVLTSFLTYMIWGFQLTVIWLVVYVKFVDWIKSFFVITKKDKKDMTATIV